ncbi:translocation protein in type III secretion system, RhcU [Mesorhizobium loti]|nr:EscU/YscU/HrcU family type III secretion system export apparatus switch protein [Mesorhizobium loti]PLP57395.1 translocation protein in type III secretion system, RhcU [Mesorhizobium loti]
MAEEAEEKRLPASDKKLRDAKRKGQVSQSRDFVSGFGLCAALAYIYIVWPTALGHFSELVDTITDYSVPFGEILLRSSRHAFFLLMFVTVPLVVVVVVTTLVFGMLATFGPVFSFETIKPQFDHINPAKGLQKIMSLRNVVEFVKGLAKLVFLSALFVVILVQWLQPLFDAPACGMSCMTPMLWELMVPVGASAALAFLAVGILDVPLQRWLFLRDMRMTTTEYKREHKDMEGDPLIRQEQRRQRREAVQQPARLGVQNAVIVFAGDELAVGLRYIKGETPVPTIVAKGQGRTALEMIAQSQASGIPVVQDAVLAQDLFEKTNIGNYISQNMFSPIVRHLVRHGLT